MPTYEYVCDACGHQWEAVQSIKEDPLKKCPSCKKLKAKRQISAGTGFILKGGGWYSDLYATPAAKGAKKDDAGATEKVETSSADTSDKPKTTTTTTKAAKSGASKAKKPKASD